VERWPEPVERVARVLREAGVDARLEEFPQGTPTAAAAAKAVGCEPAQIVKSLLFVCDGRPTLALVPGDRRADDAKVAALAGARKARVGNRDEVVAATGFEPGGVAPFPAPGVSRVLLARELLAHELQERAPLPKRQRLAALPSRTATSINPLDPTRASGVPAGTSA